MPDQDKIQLDEQGFPIPKKAQNKLNLDADGLPIPVKKKDSTPSSDDGQKTLKVSEVISGQQKVSPSQSTSPGDDKFSMKGFNLKPVSTNFLTKGLSLNEQGYIGNGAKKSNLLKAVDDQFEIHLPVTPNSKQQVQDITKAFQENNVEKIKETRDYILGKQETKKFDAQEQNRRSTLSSAPIGQPLPLDLKVASDIAHNQIHDSFEKDINHSKDVFDQYLRYAVTDRYINPPDQAAKEKLKGFEAKPEVSKQLYKGIGEEIVKNGLPIYHDRTGNASYDNTRTGLESVMENMQMEANDLISEGKATGNMNLLNLAKQKAAQIEVHKKTLDGLADEYPDVMALNTARYLGDVMHDLGYDRKVAISTADVYEAAEVIKKEHPEAYKKMEKYIKPIAESEGSGIFELLPGKIPSSGIGAQLEQSVESFLKEKVGQVARFESLGKPAGVAQAIQNVGEEARQAAESPLLQGPSQSGGLKSKIVLSEDGTFIEKPNENYGVLNFNNPVRSITHALPGLAEWIILERAGGDVVGKVLEELVDVAEVGKVTSVGGRLSEDALSLASKPSFNKKAGEITAFLATGYEPARRRADELIDDKSGWGDAKKNAFAIVNSMITAGVFHILGTSPSKVIIESFQKGISKNVLKTLEEGNFQNLTEEGVNKILNEAYPLGERLLKATGNSLKIGTGIASAGLISEKLNQLSAAIVNPKKASFSDAEDDIRGFIGQALTMSFFPAIGGIVSKGGEMPYMAKDALYDAAIHDNIMVDDIRNKVKSGEYTEDQGVMMVKAIRSFKDSVVSAQFQTTKDGTPLDNKQVKEWAAQDFRLKLKDLFKQEGKEPQDAAVVDAEVKEKKDDILKESAYHKLEDSEIFKSIKPVAEGGEKPEKYLDIDPNKKYSINIGGEDKVVMGDTLQRILSDPENYVKAKPEEITSPIELRPEITQGNLTDEDFNRVKEIQNKINPVIENGKVVKPGEALSKAEEEEYNSIMEKRNGKPYTEYDFKGLRDDDFAKKYLTEREYNKWHELDKNDDPEAKKIISDKKQELLSEKETPEAVPAKEKPTRDNLTPTIEVNGKKYTGENHAEAMNKAIAAGEDIPSPDTKEGMDFKEKNGMFQDKEGNLLTRDQTEEKYGIRHSEELLPSKKEKSSNLANKTETNAELEKHLPDTLSPTEKRGSLAGGEANAEATIITGAIQAANEKAKARGEEVPRNNRGVKYSDIFIGGKGLEDILDDNKLSDSEKNTVRSIFSTNIDYFKFDKEAERKFQEGFANPEDISDILDSIHGSNLANESSFYNYNDLNYRNVKDAIRYILENPTEFSDKVVKSVSEINQLIEKSGSGNRLFAIDISKELGLKNETTKDTNQTETKGKQPEAVDKNIGAAKEGEGEEKANPVKPPEPPKIPPIKTVENTGTPKEEWTAIRKEKQKEIDKVREAYEEQRPKSWTESMKKGLEKIQSKYPDKPLYDAAVLHRDEILSGGYVGGFEPDESLAVMQYLKNDIGNQRAELAKDLISDNEAQRVAALAKDTVLATQYIDTALAIKDLTTGFARGLNYAQSELTFDPENGLQIRRMELARDTLGNQLSDEDLAETARLFELEKETYQREAEARIRAMQEKFDSEMSKLQKRNEGKQKSEETEPKTAKERKEKLLKQSGKDLADKLRAGKIKGTFSDPLLVGQTINTVIEVLATAVEKGATLAQAIKDYIEEHKIKDAASFTKGILNHIDREDNRAETLDKIKEIATLNKVEDIHGNMVSKNLIRDYVNSFIGTVEQKDILQTATDGLKEVLPGVEKEKLVAAYLKEGEFKQKTSKELSNGISAATRSLANIAKLEEDISDLKGYKELRQRNFPTERERTEYEQQLQKEKEDIIKQRREDKAQFEKDYKQIESERNRQLAKIEELKTKRDKLQQGVREKTEKNSKVDTPEIEALKKEVAQADKELRQAESDARKVERDKKKLEEQKQKQNQAELDRQYRALETERNRQLQKVADLNKKIEDLNNGIREKREVNKNVDTPEIESLKLKAAEADKNLRDAENAARKLDRDAENKRKKISEINADIERLKEKGELLRKSKGKSEKEIDKDIKAKQDELKRVMIDKGLKVERADKYTKASYETRAKAHNERVSELSRKVEDMILSDDLTDVQKRALTLLKDRLDNGLVKLDENSALSQERVLSQGLELIKQAKAEFDRTADKNIKEIGPVKASLQRIIDQYGKDIESTKQDIAMERLKKRLENEKNEYNRKINAGEFEDNPVTELTKSDAELIKIRRDRDIIIGEYERLKRKNAQNAKSNFKKTIEMGRSLWVAYLIHKGITLGKVATSAITRPNLEAFTKFTFGRIYEKGVSPTISHLAKAGGESESLYSIKKGYQASLMKYTEEGIDKIIKNSNEEFENADEAYRNGIEVLSQIEDKRTKEYKGVSKDVKELKEKRDEALVKNASWQIFSYLSNNPYQESLQILFHRSADIEREFGHFDSEQWEKGLFKKDATFSERLGIGIDNIQYLASFFGRSHAALKNFSARQSFAASFVARLEYAVSEGTDITSADKILEIANESYLDYERGKYQQDNPITNKWNKVVSFVDREVSSSIANLARADVAIARVPINQLIEAIGEYAAGAITASVKTGIEYRKARKLAISEGYSLKDIDEFKEQIKKNISQNLTPKEAATIVRSFRKGGLGIGLYALGAIGGVGFGGLPHLGQTADDKKIAKREAKTGVKELKTGEIKIGDYTLPDSISKLVEHTPALYPMLFGLGLVQVYNNNIKLGKSTPGAVRNDVVSHINVILNNIPQYKIVAPSVERIASQIKPFGSIDSVDEQGNPIKLKPFRVSDYKNMLFDQKRLLTPSNFKKAQNVHRDMENMRANIEDNPNISEEEKQRQFGVLEQQYNDLIDQIYNSQKN